MPTVDDVSARVDVSEGGMTVSTINGDSSDSSSGGDVFLPHGYGQYCIVDLVRHRIPNSQETTRRDDSHELLAE